MNTKGIEMAQKDNDTKCKIISIAIEQIKEKGYDAVTINDICNASGVSKHTFYYYFTSKEEILLKFFEIPNEISNSRLSSILSADKNIEQLWQLIEPMVEFFSDAGPEIMKRVFIANIKRDMGTFDPVRRKSDLVIAQTALIKKAQDNREINNRSDPAALLHSLITQFMGTTAKWSMTNGVFDLKTVIRNGMEVCLDVEPSLRKTY